MSIMRMTNCPYCGEEYPLVKSCTCRCPHTTGQELVCDECIAEQLKVLKPMKAHTKNHGTRSATGPKLTKRESKEINKMMKELDQ